jgi:hypothetical protein
LLIGFNEKTDKISEKDNVEQVPITKKIFQPRHKESKGARQRLIRSWNNLLQQLIISK